MTDDMRYEGMEIFSFMFIVVLGIARTSIKTHFTLSNSVRVYMNDLRALYITVRSLCSARDQDRNVRYFMLRYDKDVYIVSWIHTSYNQSKN